jgi:hypothetical protein
MSYVVSKMKQIVCRAKIKLSKKFLVFGFLWWKSWSYGYRKLYHEMYKNLQIDKGLTLTGIQSRIDTLHWTPDGFKELWDACGSPKRVQYILDQIALGKPQPMGALDCDDFSIWAAHAIDRNFYPRILCFAWVEKETCSIKGHTVCLLRQEDGRVFHIGNWGTSTPFKNLREVCLNMMNKKHAEESIGWCLLDKNLSMLKWGVELPSGSIK